MGTEGTNGRLDQIEDRLSGAEGRVEALERDAGVFTLCILVLGCVSALLLLRGCWGGRAAMATPGKARPSLSLTFDDGPSRMTPRILDELKAAGVRGTFFVLGARLQNRRYCGHLRRAAREGHRIANHLWSHRSPCKLGLAGTMREFRRCDRDIRRCLGSKLYHKAAVLVYRPPFGHRCNAKAITATGYRVRMWDVADLGRSASAMWRKAKFWARWKQRRGSRPHITILIHHRPDKLRHIIRNAKRASWRFAP